MRIARRASRSYRSPVEVAAGEIRSTTRSRTGSRDDERIRTAFLVAIVTFDRHGLRRSTELPRRSCRESRVSRIVVPAVTRVVLRYRNRWIAVVLGISVLSALTLAFSNPKILVRQRQR